jgi:integrase/recombinase XerC
MFLNHHQQPLSVAGVQFLLKEYGHLAEVDLTCHQLRHTFARRLAEHNMPIDSLAKLLGHANLQTTQCYTSRGHKFNFFEVVEGLKIQGQ